MSEKQSLLLSVLVFVAIVVVISLVFADEESKPASPQALAAQAIKNARSAPDWRPLPAQNGLLVAAAKKVYYEPTIRDTVMNDCSRCHSGAVRNLMDYDSLKMYGDSGMLSAMIQGPMAQFAGQDASLILDWINAGAPEHPSKSTTPAAFTRAAPLAQSQRLAQLRPGGWRPLPPRIGLGQ